ncbi:MAG TPA: glycosidase, partial [Pirellulaceae bacterium]
MTQACGKSLLIGPEALDPSHHDMEVVGVFNPGVARFRDRIVVLARVAQRWRPAGDNVSLPRYERGTGYVADRVPAASVRGGDPRVVQVGHAGFARLTSISHLRVLHAPLGGGVDRLGVAIHPEGAFEEYGIEDPRITQLEDRYYITYVAVSRHGAATALMSTNDFEHFERHGLLFPPENKDVVLFPKKIGGEYIALHRPVGRTPFTSPEMWVGRSPTMRHWGMHQPLHRGHLAWETGRVGAGAPPIATSEGWLELYHGNTAATDPIAVGAYCAGGMLLALEDPTRILALTPHPILIPDQEFETHGFVPNVIFPTGVIDTPGMLFVYYGAADH